jgi:hypothetical protein
MRHPFATALAPTLLLASLAPAFAAEYAGYAPLDPAQPVSFDGNTVKWNGKTFTLDDNTLFLDYRLDKAKLAGNPHAFNNLKDAVAALKDGTPEKPMMLLTAPGVYWVDDPDDPAIRGGAGGPPIGMAIACNNLYFYGLNSKWENVVFAVNRGQTQGSNGNFTMFNIQGTGLKSENVTFGNYCNVDLKFPLNPALSRPKRTEAITQAQLFSYSGGDGIAINSAFISRLNLLPFPRVYLNCHIESHGHSGGGNVFINSTLEFYGTNFSGGRNYFNCDIYLKPDLAIYQGRSSYSFGVMDGTGSGGIAIDTRIHRSKELIDNNVTANFSWDKVPQSPLTRAYQNNVTMDGKPFIIQEAATPGATIVIPDNSELLKAFKVTYNGQTYYNVPNVSGTDPFGYTSAIKAAAKAAGKDEDYYLSIPTGAALRPEGAGGGGGLAGAPAGRAGRGGRGGLARGGPGGRGGLGGFGGGAGGATIRSGQTTATFVASVTPASAASSPTVGKWHFRASNPDMVQITPGDNNTITVAGTNKTPEAAEVLIIAKNDLGLEAVARLTVEPAFTEPPKFVKAPAIAPPADGRATLAYDLGLTANGPKDESVITWYRAADAKGSDPLKVAVSRRDKPETTYTLSDGDVGSYLMATIQPKHSQSEPGPLQTVYAASPIAKDDVKLHELDTDFQNVPADSQPKILPATWTLDGYGNAEGGQVNTRGFTAAANSWTYGQGTSGGLNYFGLIESARGARLFYTPANGNYSNMNVRAKFAPNKNTGQGFGSATNQFLDVYIKYDLATLTGYGLRIQRLTPEEIKAIGFNGDGAVAGCAVFLVRYDHGAATPITKKTMTTAFVSECTVELSAENGKLTGSVTSTEKSRSGDTFDYPREARLEAPIEANSFGGTGMHFTGTVGVNAVVVTGWHASWSK